MKNLMETKVEITVTAVQVTEDNKDDAAKWCEGWVGTTGRLWLNDPIGEVMQAHPGEWIINCLGRYDVLSDEQYRKMLDDPERWL